MENNLKVNWNQSDFDNVQRIISEMSSRLGIDIKNATKWAAISVAKSISASTRKAPNKRKIIKATPQLLGYNMQQISKSERLAIKASIEEYPWGVMLYGGKPNPRFARISKLNRKMILFKSFTTNDIVGRFDGEKTIHSAASLYASNKQAVNEGSSLVRISKAGLCKKTWLWLSKYAKMNAKSRYASTQVSLNGFVITMANLLNYALSALGGKNTKPVDEAIYRAWKGMEGNLAKKIEQAAKGKK